MGEAKKRRAIGEGIRTIPMQNGKRAGLVQVLRERVAAEGKDAKEGMYRALAAVVFDEEERDAIDERNERLEGLQEQIEVLKASGGSLDRLIELQAERKAIADENKAWRKTEQEVTISVPTLAKIMDEFWAAKGVYARGLEDLMPLIETLEEAKADDSEFNPARKAPDEPSDGKAAAAPPHAAREMP